jgi:hypothetical protein
MINDTAPTAGAGGFDIVRQIVNKQNLRWLTLGEFMAMNVNIRTGFTQADLVRQNQGVEVSQRVGELTAELESMQFVGITQQQQTIARLQRRHQLANLFVGREHISNRRIELFIAARQAAALTHLSAEVGKADSAGLEVILQLMIEIKVQNFIDREWTVRGQLLGGLAMTEEAEYVAEIENKGGNTHTYFVMKRFLESHKRSGS